MKVMVVGSGGREHALAWKLSRDREVESIVCCPGNPGIAELATCLPVTPDDATGLLAACNERSIDLVVFGPEEPLVKGVGEWLKGNGVNVFGPSRGAARLEGSKAFAKLFMERHKIPTAGFRILDSYADARESVRGLDGRVVVKADGLAGGKGVMICTGESEAERALREIMVERRFGTAGERVIIEEFLEGEEVSVMAICDGEDVALLPCSKDHKKVFDNDRGPNTGGMGAFCPVPWIEQDLLDVIESTIMRRVVEGLAEEGSVYAGVLYAGLMLTSGGPKVLEFNCRFGDPEAQVVLPAGEFEVAQMLLEASEGRLGRRERLEAGSHCVCVVVCSGGYPGDYEVGKEIVGLDSLRDTDGVLVFQAGTQRRGDRLVTAGGRVLGVVGVTPTLTEARAKAYEAVRMIDFEGIHYRGDIGAKALRGERM
ncbi:MAG: phosphoribosylamine--glycine ligase [Candidatus Eisenbacteria bacterium]|nr:phosphoribosylamine--glycine ligase [Candidatus Eisenbacteria bacterium]